MGGKADTTHHAQRVVAEGDVRVERRADGLLLHVRHAAEGVYQLAVTLTVQADCKGIDSKILLKKVIDMIENKGFAIGNIDCVICLQRPKIKMRTLEMRECLSEIMGIDVDEITIKATTTEKLGFEGREEGVSAYVTVLIIKL